MSVKKNISAIPKSSLLSLDEMHRPFVIREFQKIRQKDPKKNCWDLLFVVLVKQGQGAGKISVWLRGGAILRVYTS